MRSLHRGVEDAVVSGDCRSAVYAVDTHFQVIDEIDLEVPVEAGTWSVTVGLESVRCCRVS
jgi:hypothetical protein